MSRDACYTPPQEPPFWHRPMIPAAFKKGGTQWHMYLAGGQTVCGKFALIGTGIPEGARSRMPSRAHPADVCKECERKRP